MALFRTLLRMTHVSVMTALVSVVLRNGDAPASGTHQRGMNDSLHIIGYILSCVWIFIQSSFEVYDLCSAIVDFHSCPNVFSFIQLAYAIWSVIDVIRWVVQAIRQKFEDVDASLD